MVIGPLIGAASAILGIYLSWSLDLPAGGTIGLVATGIFLACWVVSRRGGARTVALRA